MAETTYKELEKELWAKREKYREDDDFIAFITGLIYFRQWEEAKLMALIDKLKQIILDLVEPSLVDPSYESCPSNYGLEDIRDCEFPRTCYKCWPAALEKAEREEASADG